MQKENECKCVPFEAIIRPSSLAQAYIPFQKYCYIFEDEKGLVRGTVFPELFCPYCKNPMKDCKENASCNKDCKKCQ